MGRTSGFSWAFALSFVLSCVTAGADPEPGPPREPVAAVCMERGALPPLSDPWLEIEPDPDADQNVPGYIELLRFRSQPAGENGRALVVRLAGLGDAPPLFRGEKRAWALWFCSEEGEMAIGYSYLDPRRLDHLWLYRPLLPGVERQSHESTGETRPTDRLCSAITTSGLAEEVEILQRTTGRVKDRRKLRAAINPIRWPHCP